MTVRMIDFPNNGGPCSESDTPRVETGAVQFGKDWPGLFVRGDEAIGLACYIGYVEPYIKDLLAKHEQGMLSLREFEYDHLDRAISALSALREIIDNEVNFSKSL